MIMLGQTSPSQGLDSFDLNSPFQVGKVGAIDPNASMGQAAQPATPSQPFVWGAGGGRLSPDQLALRQKNALAQSQADYSPIQSWTQGLARVAQNVTGALELRRLDKQDEATQAEHQNSVAALLAAGSPVGAAPSATSAVAAALTSNDPVLQKLGMAQWERDHPKPVNNDSAQDWDFYKANLTPEQFEMWKTNKIYNPPHFAIIDNAPAMVGGYQPPTANQGPPPPNSLPADFDFGDK